MKISLPIGLAAVAFFLFTPPTTTGAQDAASKPLKSLGPELRGLQGTWQGVERGREDAGTCSVTVAGDSIRFQGASKEEWYHATVTIPPDKNPRQLHAKVTACGDPDFVGKTALAIYKLEKDTLTLTGRAPGVLEPPTQFEGDSKTRTFVLKKAASKEKAAADSPGERKTSSTSDPARTIQQRFEEADLELALTQYKKLRDAAFELRLKMEIEGTTDERKMDEWAKRQALLQAWASELRQNTLQRVAASGR